MPDSISPFQPDGWHPSACVVDYPLPGNVPYVGPAAPLPFYTTTVNTGMLTLTHRISDEDVERIAQRVAELLRSK